MKEKPQFKVLMCRKNNYLIICLLLVWVRFGLHSRYEMSQQDIRVTKYAHYQHVLRWASQMQSGRPFIGREDQWMDVRLTSFIKATKFKRDSAERDSMSNLMVYLDEVSEYSRPSHQVSRCLPERDHSMGIVYRSSASRRSNRKRNS